ncbi:competence protein CoiA family protein [Aeromonas sp. 6P]|uniref:competence protein CoiA family protein n=2 Tax=unclassified Aeromonas TaxID=257493 RepID=UPI003F78E512
MPVKMSRAFDASKGIVSIEDVPSGKACGCTCIDCNEPLVAKKGEVNRHHFAHEPPPLSDVPYANVRECHWMPETDLHIMAKEVLAEDMQLSLPIGFTSPRQELLAFDTVKLEFPEGSRIPDVIGYVKGEKILIEIAVTHFCDEAKVKYLRRINATCIELDFSKFSLDVEVLSKDSVRAYLAHCPKKLLTAAPVGPIAEAFQQQERRTIRSLIEQSRKLKDQVQELVQQVKRYEAQVAGYQPELTQMDAVIANKRTLMAGLERRIEEAEDRLFEVEKETQSQKELLALNASRLQLLDQLSIREAALKKAERAVEKRMAELDKEVQLRLKGLSADLDNREHELKMRDVKLNGSHSLLLLKTADLRAKEEKLKQDETDFMKRVNSEAARLGRAQCEMYKKQNIAVIRAWENYYDSMIKKIEKVRREFCSRVTFPETPPALEKFDVNQSTLHFSD